MKLKEVCKKKQQSKLSSDELFDFYHSLDGNDKSRLLKSIESLRLFFPTFQFFTVLGKEENINEVAHLLEDTEWFRDKNTEKILSLRHTGGLVDFTKSKTYYPYLADDGIRYPVAKLIRFEKIPDTTKQ